ncbi:MAG TPA: NUDIX domain-containing protein [Steroidobacteraceae bacterium]|nr:NUDIX domain-containing protein [Steroidobacteraceae bacterium]
MSSERLGPAIHVVAGAVIDAEDRVLIAQRPPGKHLAGGWEFPGGKLRSGEDRRAGLTRELREEIGIEIRTPRPLLRLLHTYPFGQVSLDVWVVRHYLGEPQALDGQALRWCTMSELESTELLPADAPVIAALRLPERLIQASTSHYTVADASVRTADGLLRGVFCTSLREAEQAVAAGADFLVLRGAASDGEISALCAAVSVPVYVRGLALEHAWALGASGIGEIAD